MRSFERLLPLSLRIWKCGHADVGADVFGNLQVRDTAIVVVLGVLQVPMPDGAVN